MVGPTISVQTSCTEFDAVSGFRLLVLRRTGLPVPVDIVHEVPALTSSTVRARAHRRARRGRGGVARSDPLEPVVALPGHADGGPRAAVHVPGRGARAAASGLGVPPCYPDVCAVRQCKSKRHACPAKSHPRSKIHELRRRMTDMASAREPRLSTGASSTGKPEADPPLYRGPHPHIPSPTHSIS